VFSGAFELLVLLFERKYVTKNGLCFEVKSTKLEKIF
jgi:hypothetical protein